jgi:hypothetical protein
MEPGKTLKAGQVNFQDSINVNPAVTEHPDSLPGQGKRYVNNPDGDK